MKSFRRVIIVFALLNLIALLAFINYSDLQWATNKGNYFGVFPMVCVIASMILSNRFEKKNEKVGGS